MSHYKTGNILVIPDLHIPADRDNFLDFIIDVKKKYKCDYFYSVGDMFDFHGMSYHEKETEYPSISEEVKKARKKIVPWKKAFKKLNICIGNHDLLIYRKAKTHGFSKEFIKTWNEIFDLPDSWVWERNFTYNNILFMHGIGFSGKYPYANAMERHRMNVVMGHTHSSAGVYYSASQKDLLWGMGVGCGVDDEKVVFEYGQEYPRKSIISCGVILENGRVPLVIPMEL